VDVELTRWKQKHSLLDQQLSEFELERKSWAAHKHKEIALETHALTTEIQTLRKAISEK
jgi:hypothetical protein